MPAFVATPCERDLTRHNGLVTIPNIQNPNFNMNFQWVRYWYDRYWLNLLSIPFRIMTGSVVLQVVVVVVVVVVNLMTSVRIISLITPS